MKSSGDKKELGIIIGNEKAHILVVDDDERLRELLQKYLRDNGFRVTTSEDAASTRKKIKKHPVYNKKLEPLLFENLENVSDLLKLTVEDEKGNKINISQHLVSFYHLLFPSQIQ